MLTALRDSVQMDAHRRQAARAAGQGLETYAGTCPELAIPRHPLECIRYDARPLHRAEGSPSSAAASSAEPRSALRTEHPMTADAAELR